MLGVTIFGIFFTPVFYSVIRWLTTPGVAATKFAAKLAPVEPDTSPVKIDV